MKKFILVLLLLTTPAYTCEECLKAYIDYEIADSETVIQKLIDSDTEESIAYFFFAVGRKHALSEVKRKLGESCKADLHD